MTDERDSHTYDTTRRSVLSATGAVGASGIASGTSGGGFLENLVTSKPSTPAFQTENVVGDEDWMYDTVQGAHDDLPDGGRVYVTESYDTAKETFPIELTNHVHVEGANRSSTLVDASGSGAPAFVISEVAADGSPLQDYDRSMTIENLRIEGGTIGVLIRPETHVLLEDLMIVGQEKHGVAARENSGAHGSFLNYFHNVNVNYCGSHAFDLTYKSVAHATVLNQCTALRNDGNGANLTGVCTVVKGGAYQYNRLNGIELRDTSAFTIRDVYLEGNGKVDDYNAQIYARGQRDLLPIGKYLPRLVGVSNVCIEGNYFNQAGFAAEGDVGIHLEHVRSATIQSNSYAGYAGDGEGFLYVDDTCTDVDYHRPSNAHHEVKADWVEHFLQDDQGYRTRSDGIVQPTDLSSVEGMFEGDRAYDDGTNTPSGNARLYVWQDGTWVDGDDTIEFTGHGDTDASVSFSSQTWDGVHLTVDSATLPDGGFVSILDLDGKLIGHSDYLPAGTHEDVEVIVREDGTRGIAPDGRHPTHWLSAMIHRDSNGNRRFDWVVDSLEQVDEPYLDGIHPIYDGDRTTVE